MRQNGWTDAIVHHLQQVHGDGSVKDDDGTAWISEAADEQKWQILEDSFIKHTR